MGELERKPWQCHRLHPRADGGHDLTHQEEAVVAVPQRSEKPRRGRFLHQCDHRSVARVRESIYIDASRARGWAGGARGVKKAPKWTGYLEEGGKLNEGPKGKGA